MTSNSLRRLSGLIRSVFRFSVSWVGNARLHSSSQFVSAKIFAFGRRHLWHGSVGLAVVVGGIPEQESDAALVLGGYHLRFDVLRRVSPGSPAEGLEPGTDHYAAALGDLFEADHRLPDEVL